MTLNEDNTHSTTPAGQLSDPGSLSPEDFEPFVGDQFRVMNRRAESVDTHVNPIARPEDPVNAFQEVVELTLVEVTRYSNLRGIERDFKNRLREPFSLLFESDYSGLMAAQLEVTHSLLGSGKLCFGPVALPTPNPAESTNSKFFYEVVFG